MNKIFIYALLLFGSVACQQQEKQPEAPESFPVTQLKTIDTSVFRTYVADIQAVQNVEISNRVPGFLEKILCR